MAKRSKPQNQGNGKKHKNDSRLDPIFGQYRALPVPQSVLDSVTENSEPIDAETYLAIVRKQAENGPPVMFLPREEVERVEIEKVRTEPIDGEFHSLAMQEFTQMREQLPEAGVMEIPPGFVFPETFTAWRQYCMTHEPEIALVSNLDQALTIKLLVYFSKWLAPKTPVRLSQWLFSVLTRVLTPLTASDVSVLRELAKRASQLAKRDELSETTSFTCQLVLHIVGDAFGQRDLL